MKIYNEVVTIFNENTGQWETISEDSFDYNGSVVLAQGGLPNNATAISAQDTITDTIKNTTGYFTNGDGTISGYDIITGSLSDSNEKYYFNVQMGSGSNAETQFSVTFGHVGGSGSNQYGDSTAQENQLIGETRAIYNQLATWLLEPQQISGGFKISSAGRLSATVSASGVSDVRDDYVYALIGKRNRFKDRINKKTWTLVLSGSLTDGRSGSMLSLTDDSINQPATATPAGPRYNIVSGTLGSVTVAASERTYGWFYPERGMFIFSGTELSASIPGRVTYGKRLSGTISASYGIPYISGSGTAFNTELSSGDLVKLTSGSFTQYFKVSGVQSATLFTASDGWLGPKKHGGAAASDWITGSAGVFTDQITASFNPGDEGEILSASGFAPNLYAGGNPKNALRFVNCLRLGRSQNVLQLRSEEDASQENFFCRIKANQYNFSSNPTFVSGSYNKIRNQDMHGNPTTFITGVGLYNSAGQLLAIASLSKPLKKTFASEATIKVKLTY
jgi:hypothetical protein